MLDALQNAFFQTGDTLTSWLSAFSSFLWGWPLLIMLLGTHLYLTAILRFPQRYLLKALKLYFVKDHTDKGDISPFSSPDGGPGSQHRRREYHRRGRGDCSRRPRRRLLVLADGSSGNGNPLFGRITRHQIPGGEQGRQYERRPHVRAGTRSEQQMAGDSLRRLHGHCRLWNRQSDAKGTQRRNSSTTPFPFPPGEQPPF